jgi:hypothetical protein
LKSNFHSSIYEKQPMILVYAILLLIGLALIFRSDVKSLGYIQFRGGWKLALIVVTIFALQWVLIITNPERTVLHTALLVLSHTGALLLVWLNRHIPGAVVFAAGIVLNTVAMLANGGWMPVTPELVRYVDGDPNAVLVSTGKNIILPYTETRLWLLSDIIPVALPWRRWAISIGDILLVLGIAQFLFKAVPGSVPIREASQP